MKPELSCDRCRSFLPEYVNGRLAESAQSLVRAHLATCSACQAEVSAWRVIAGTVRGSDSQARPALSLTEAQRRLHARIADQRGTAQPKGHAPMHDNLQTPPLTVSSIIPPPKPFNRTYPLIAAFLLAALLVAFFVVRQTRTGVAHPGTCDSARSTSGVAAFGSVDDIAMVSPTEGWGVGFVWNPPVTNAPRSLIVHYHNCRWTPLSESTSGILLTSISMASPSEGWASGFSEVYKTITSHGQPVTGFQPDQPVLLHFSNDTWQRVAFPASFTPGGQGPVVQMVAHDDAWLQWYPMTTDGTKIALAHYQHGTWTTVPLPFATPTTQIRKMVAVAADDCWLLGSDTNTDNFVAHYQHGSWSLWHAPVGVELIDLAMTSATDGVVMGGRHGQGTDYTSLFLAQYGGAQWQAQSVPDISANHVFSLGPVAHLPGHVWLGDTTNDGAQPFILHSMNGQWQTQIVPSPNAFIGRIVMVTPTEGWATVNLQTALDSTSGFGRGILIHYHNGAWVTLPDK